MDTLTFFLAQATGAPTDGTATDATGATTNSPPAGGPDPNAVDPNAVDPGLSGLTFDEFIRGFDLLHEPQSVLSYLIANGWLWPTVLTILGLLCILNGYRWHRPLVALLAFISGIGLGNTIAAEMGRPVLIGLAIGLLFAVIATPLLKLSVAMLAGATGAFIGANFYRSVEATQRLTEYFQTGQEWVGGAIGFVALAMLSLMLFRFCVVLFTSVGGAGMLIFGGVALLMLVPDWKPAIETSISDTPLLVPTLTLLAAVAGFVLQHARLREEGVKLFSAEGG